MSPAFNLDDYVPVHERIEAFRKEHPDWRLSTQILVDDGQRVVMKATVASLVLGTDTPLSVWQVIATGHAEEVRGQGQVNKTSAIENAETSAVGRALANMGYSISRGLASREEMAKASRGDWYEQNGWPGGRSQHDEEREKLITKIKTWDDDAKAQVKERFDFKESWTRDYWLQVKEFVDNL